MITQLIEFDVKKDSHVKITAKEGDINSRNLEFRLLDNSLPFSLVGRTVRCYMVKPDKRIVFSELQIIDAEDGRCVLTLSLQSLIVSGMAKLELIIYEAGKKLSVIPIKMDIIKSLNSNKLLESTNEFGALNNALWKIDTFTETMNSKASKEDLKKLSSQLDTIENEKLGGNILVEWENIGQSVRENITSGNTAVVGEASVGNINVIDKSISTFKTNFSTSYINLANISELSENKYFTLNENNIITATQNGYYTLKIGIKPNRWYSIKDNYAGAFTFYGDSNLVNLGKVIDMTREGYRMIFTPSNAKFICITFATIENANDFMIFEGKFEVKDFSKEDYPYNTPKKVKIDELYCDGIGYFKDLNNKFSNIDYYSVKENIKTLIEISEFTAWNSPTSVNITNEKASYIGKNTGNSGLKTPTITPDGNNYVFININADIPDNNDVILYLSNGSKFLSLGKLFSGNNKIKYDPAYYSVYENLDSGYYIISSQGEIAVTINEFKIFQSDIYDIDIYSDKLPNIIKNIQREIDNTNSAISNIGNFDLKLISPNGNKFTLNISDDGSISTVPIIPNKTLFIGNSLLLGNKGFGMCATTSKKDYYYYVTEHIKSLNSNVTFEKLQGNGFEGCTSQEQVQAWINDNLENKADDINLIFVQLGDNVNTTDKVNTFRTSCGYLLKYLRNKFKNARIVWVGMWYSSSEKIEIVSNACSNTGCQFINISDLNTSENQGKIGDTIYYDDETTSVVTSSGVASHPGDVGMTKIANRIIEKSF